MSVKRLLGLLERHTGRFCDIGFCALEANILGATSTMASD